MPSSPQRQTAISTKMRLKARAFRSGVESVIHENDMLDHMINGDAS